AAHQLEQMRERVRKAAEKKDQIGWNRRRRLETMVLPFGTPAERVYPPLVTMLAHGSGALHAIRDASTGSQDGAPLPRIYGAAAGEGAWGGEPGGRRHADGGAPL